MEAFVGPGGSSVGEHQLAHYTARLEIGDCARILMEGPISRPVLAALRDGCRVDAGERRAFEEVMRV